ncbi:MAG: hypothetical protein U1E50_15460 [Caulobacteraceae bacterium]
MSKRQRLFRAIERRWVVLFGEPPSIRADPDLMLRLLDEHERARRDAPVQTSEAA